MLKKTIIVGGALLLLSLISSHGFAEDSIIHGCYQKSSRQLRAVTGPDKCKENEIYLYWGQTGPTGPQAPQGPVGADGVVNPHPHLQPIKDNVCEFQALNHIPLVTYCPSKYVFVTSQLGTGDFSSWPQTSKTGATGANDVCQSLAQAAGLHGTYKAWISDSSSIPYEIFTRSTKPYVLVGSRVAVALDWGDLTDGSLLTAINQTEEGLTVSERSSLVWTNLWIDGTQDAANSNANCLDWTNSNAHVHPANIVGQVGYPNARGYGWTQSSHNLSLCNQHARLYCFEQ